METSKNPLVILNLNITFQRITIFSGHVENNRPDRCRVKKPGTVISGDKPQGGAHFTGALSVVPADYTAHRLCISFTGPPANSHACLLAVLTPLIQDKNDVFIPGISRQSATDPERKTEI
ncbi:MULTISPECIES: hypothetical protein [Tatumella]|uniref:Uncharacterized protein n=1 Tax=Tatumella punctata TaxID=399969 RepID=A0ABW1VN91_9GAMM|nr:MULTISPECIES: hypothetical protein [unclassified Tatumella]MBS0856296.1 hypothetical protein [Tatumella sp. JGM16]MBS0876355.1 hypothetical protein [Tatumella sp. JGM82]MBS0889528.1 hypothetical protein [Tatumella sp. JGM94]MBS0900650.1 hypothetical protein [Tatumella sp. JGM100]MBS0913395.1 hypothetical protein [Tatumella sp. JGM91]